jgi:hypothetical protein
VSRVKLLSEFHRAPTRRTVARLAARRVAQRMRQLIESDGNVPKPTPSFERRASEKTSWVADPDKQKTGALGSGLRSFLARIGNVQVSIGPHHTRPITQDAHQGPLGGGPLMVLPEAYAGLTVCRLNQRNAPAVMSTVMSARVPVSRTISRSIPPEDGSRLVGGCGCAPTCWMAALS